MLSAVSQNVSLSQKALLSCVVDDWGATKPEHVPLTRAEALALSRKNPGPSMTRVFGAQLLVMLALASLLGLFFGTLMALSALYGGLCWLVPSACMAWGLGLIKKRPTPSAMAALLRFGVWEAIKLALALALLLLAQVLLPQVHWLALLAGLLLTAKTQWWVWMVKVS